MLRELDVWGLMFKSSKFFVKILILLCENIEWFW